MTKLACTPTESGARVVVNEEGGGGGGRGSPRPHLTHNAPSSSPRSPPSGQAKPPLSTPQRGTSSVTLDGAQIKTEVI